MAELIRLYFSIHDSSIYTSAVLSLSVIINIAAWYVSVHNPLQRTNLLHERYMPAFFGLGVLASVFDLIPSSSGSELAVYAQLILFLICCCILLSACIKWLRRLMLPMMVLAMVVLAVLIKVDNAALLVYMLAAFDWVCFGSLLLVFAGAFRRSRNIGYVFLSLACIALISGATYSAWLTLHGDELKAAEVVNACCMIGFSLIGVGYMMVVQYREQRVLGQLAVQDPLTELLNRRGLDESFNLQQLTSAVTWCVAAVDIDHFKQINDTYGHAVGDKVIRHVADAMRREARSSDILGRFGGEEFVLVLLNSAEDNALKVAERIRHSVASNPCLIEGRAISCTISIGVAKGNVELGLQHSLKLADTALYRAKAGGRNRVVSANAPDSEWQTTASNLQASAPD